MLTEGKAAMDGSTASLPSGVAFGFATRTLEQSGAARLVQPLQRLVASKDRTTQNLDGEDSFDVDPIIDELNNKLFTEANYLGNGVYRVPAELVCSETVYDDTTNTTTEVIDPECAQNLAKAELRIRVEDDDGLRFWVQLDANHDEPLGITLRHDELALTVNLDDATDAMIALAQVFGEQAPNADLRGQVTSSLKIHGHAHAGASVSFDRAINIKFADQGIGLDSDGAYRFASAAGEVISIDLDGNTPKANLALGLGLTTAHIAGDSTDPSTDFVLGGATVDATFQGNTLTLDNISLGNQTTTLAMGGQQAIAIDLNPNDGRKLSATVTADPVTGTETLTVSPRLDLQTSINHTVLGDEVDVYDVTRVLLDGSLRGSADGTQIEVVSGSFSLATNPASYGFSATAGQCVFAVDMYDETTFTSWTEYSVGACQ
ncbi:MAG TPA: hypothetical protein VIV40_33155 [Kofleriaceae bacterium]